MGGYQIFFTRSNLGGGGCLFWRKSLDNPNTFSPLAANNVSYALKIWFFSKIFENATIWAMFALCTMRIWKFYIISIDLSRNLDIRRIFIYLIIFLFYCLFCHISINYNDRHFKHTSFNFFSLLFGWGRGRVTIFDKNARKNFN